MKNLFKRQYALILSAILLVTSIAAPPPSNDPPVPPGTAVVFQAPGEAPPSPPVGPGPKPIELE